MGSGGLSDLKSPEYGMHHSAKCELLSSWVVVRCRFVHVQLPHQIVQCVRAPLLWEALRS